MFSKKKTECRVCGYRFTPERENIYTAEEPRSRLKCLPPHNAFCVRKQSKKNKVFLKNLLTIHAMCAII